MPTIIISINSLLDLTLAKRKRSKSPAYCIAKTGSLTNNPLVVCNTFNKGSFTLGGYERLRKYRNSYRNWEYGVESCTKRKWRVGTGFLGIILLDGGKIVQIAISIAMNNDLSLLKFMNPFSSLPVSSRLKTTNCCQFVNILQPSL